MTIDMNKKKIAVFANGWSNEFLEKALSGIRTEAAKDGVDIFVYMTYIFLTDSAPQSMCQLNVFHLPDPEEYDGAIMFANTFNIPHEKERVCRLFQSKGIPIISTEVQIPDMAFIGTDNYSGVSELATHLVEKHNVKKVVYVSGIAGNAECEIRRKALEDKLHGYGLEIEGTFTGNFSFYDASVNLDKWLNEGHEMPEAFVCANDFMAMGITDTLHKRGVRVPEDVIVTGFDGIRESRTYLPIIATVSREWDELGAQAYISLKKLMEKPDPSFSLMLPSKFIPSESCGCNPDDSAIEFRNEKLRGSYFVKTTDDLLDICFQKMRIAVSKVEDKQKYHDVTNQVFEEVPLFDYDFSICIEQEVFNPDPDDGEGRRVRGYSSVMDVINEKKNGKITKEIYSFDTKSVVPGYRHIHGTSNMYIITPLNNNDLILGYIVLRNSIKPIGDLSFRKWVMNLNSMFVTVRQYIISQINNRKLKEIYMTDFLTGMYNRTGCEKVIYSHIEEEKQKGNSLVLLFADIDNMKIVNDKYGHLNGDTAIKATADAMMRSLPNDWLFGRYGGDEFIAVGECKNERLVYELRDDLSKSIRKHISSFNLQFDMTVSVGFVIIRPEDSFDIDDYIQCADDFMYEEKEKAHRAVKK